MRRNKRGASDAPETGWRLIDELSQLITYLEGYHELTTLAVKKVIKGGFDVDEKFWARANHLDKTLVDYKELATKISNMSARLLDAQVEELKALQNKSAQMVLEGGTS